MRRRNGGEFEVHVLTCPVCGALPGTSCLNEDYQELAAVHPTRRMSVAERNLRTADGWEPPELTERRTRDQRERAPRAPVFITPLPEGQVPPTDSARDHVLAYLAGLPKGTAVPRQALRDIARQRTPQSGSRPASESMLARRQAGDARVGSSRGDRSAMRLQHRLKRLEAHGLIIRDADQDVIVITSPRGLQVLLDTGNYPGHREDRRGPGSFDRFY